jgi:dihydropteridine reductase
MLSSSRWFCVNSSRHITASCSFHASSRPTQKNALVVGSSGALGTAVSRHLLRMNVNVIGADIQDTAETVQLHSFIPLPHPGQLPSLGEVTRRLTAGVQDGLEQLEGDEHGLDLIVVASGGWEGDPLLPEEATDEDAVMYGDSIDRMMRMNLYPVVASGFVAQYHMNKSGLVVAMGATAALSPTPGMIGYGLAKSGTHHFVQTFGTLTGMALNTKARRKHTKQFRKNFESMDDMTIVGILPTMLDTASNRKADPKGDFEKWTKPSDIAKEISEWMENPHLRPHSGSLIKVFSNADGASFQLAR